MKMYVKIITNIGIFYQPCENAVKCRYFSEEFRYFTAIFPYRIVIKTKRALYGKNIRIFYCPAVLISFPYAQSGLRRAGRGGAGHLYKKSGFNYTPVS